MKNQRDDLMVDDKARASHGFIQAFTSKAEKAGWERRNKIIIKEAIAKVVRGDHFTEVEMERTVELSLAIFRNT